MWVHQIPSTKAFLLLCFCLLSLTQCSQTEQDKAIETTDFPHVLKDILVLKAAEGLVYFKNTPFTGYEVTFYNKDFFSTKTRYFNGVKDGKSQKWFEEGTLSYEANYTNGRLHGNVTSWWRNGNKRSESNYVDGIGEGIQLQWYKSGVKFKRITLVNGKEEGLQQSWRENGKLYNNYEAKNGRIFGLKRATLCYELDDEKIQLQD